MSLRRCPQPVATFAVTRRASSTRTSQGLAPVDGVWEESGPVPAGRPEGAGGRLRLPTYGAGAWNRSRCPESTTGHTAEPRPRLARGEPSCRSSTLPRRLPGAVPWMSRQPAGHHLLSRLVAVPGHEHLGQLARSGAGGREGHDGQRRDRHQDHHEECDGGLYGWCVHCVVPSAWLGCDRRLLAVPSLQGLPRLQSCRRKVDCRCLQNDLSPTFRAWPGSAACRTTHQPYDGANCGMIDPRQAAPGQAGSNCWRMPHPSPRHPGVRGWFSRRLSCGLCSWAWRCSCFLVDNPSIHYSMNTADAVL
jgi:hypothetical protein